jgi:hypothetical protein
MLFPYVNLVSEREALGFAGYKGIIMNPSIRCKISHSVTLSSVMSANISCCDYQLNIIEYVN